ncbi:unnamed protein product [Candida verbasci]|uniref:Uncharacterized protein n=1 Tax=Candida verbasci TaxID=1227364 RepID=A0A9W4XC03_9ASCO|nr:unnamed protein product [Candida verbasci]
MKNEKSNNESNNEGDLYYDDIDSLARLNKATLIDQKLSPIELTIKYTVHDFTSYMQKQEEYSKLSPDERPPLFLLPEGRLLYKVIKFEHDFAPGCFGYTFELVPNSCKDVD